MSTATKPKETVESRFEAGMVRFFKLFTHAAPHFKWRLFKGYKVRTWIDQQSCCPMQALGWFNSHDAIKHREVPDTKSLGTICNLGDKVAACVVHLADDIRSRYYKDELRAQLLQACGLEEVDLGAEETEDDRPQMGPAVAHDDDDDDDKPVKRKKKKKEADEDDGGVIDGEDE